MRGFMERHFDDVLCVIGAGLIIEATLQLSLIAALYVAGGFFLLAGILAGIGSERV